MAPPDDGALAVPRPIPYQEALMWREPSGNDNPIRVFISRYCSLLT